MDFPSLFTVDPELAFLNAGTLSRVPKSVLDFLDQRRRADEKNPTAAMFRAPSEIWNVQKQIAAFLGAEGKDIFLRENVTTALGDFLFALPLPPKSEVLLSSWEYGATANIARWKAQQEGLTVRTFSFRLAETKAAFVQRACEELRPETKALVLSHVATGTGVVLPVDEIAREAQSRGIVVVVDGAHAVGALPLRLSSLEGVDFYGGNFHKWFLGPKGTAFGWVHPRWQGRLAWKFGGWASFSFPSFYQDFAAGDAEAARRYMPGTIDPTPFLALQLVLDFWQAHQAEKIRRRQGELRDLVAQTASRLGWERVTPRAPELLGPLVTFRKPAHWPEGDAIELANRIFYEAKVQLALTMVEGEMLVRFSPGIYGSEGEILSGMERLARFS